VNGSISRQLVLWLAVPLTLLALCGALVHYFGSVAPGVMSSDKRLKAAAGAVIAHVTTRDGAVVFDPDAAGPPLPPADAIQFAVRNDQGSVLAGNAEVPQLPLGSDANQSIAMLQLEHRSVRGLTTRLDTEAGAVLISLAETRPVAAPSARYGFISTLLWDFVQLDVTLVLVWVGIQLGLRPLKRLRDEIAARSPQDLRAIDEASAPREIAPVVVTLNRLFNTLRSSAQSQQQFIANTAHQLRTPITGLQAQLELLLAEPAAAPINGRLLTLQEGIKQLSHSANQLLTLARADANANIATRKRDVRLEAIVAEVAARYFDRALRANLDLGVETTPVSVIADPALLDDLLCNLVDNALKYTPAGGSVTIRAGEHQGRPFLAVEDTGPGIPEGERQRVRQRFYRLPNSPGHGSGLGLAIVDEIARVHEASVSIGPGAGDRGAKVTLRFA
jgi:two-component system sensor histidine kinase TctE